MHMGSRREGLTTDAYQMLRVEAGAGASPKKRTPSGPSHSGQEISFSFQRPNERGHSSQKPDSDCHSLKNLIRRERTSANQWILVGHARPRIRSRDR
jgi:hypothetical protein